MSNASCCRSARFSRASSRRVRNSDLIVPKTVERRIHTRPTVSAEHAAARGVSAGRTSRQAQGGWRLLDRAGAGGAPFGVKVTVLYSEARATPVRRPARRSARGAALTPRCHPTRRRRTRSPAAATGRPCTKRWRSRTSNLPCECDELPLPVCSHATTRHKERGPNLG
jgi:hypothetical protein